MSGTRAIFIATVAAFISAAAGASIAADEPTVRVGFTRAGGGYGVESIPLETYVARVLAGEAARDSPPAALDALAITIRTFALANRGRHRADGFDLCDATHCQVVRAATAATVASAARTAGRILLAAGAPAAIYYTASCGGRTEIPSAVWPGASDPPYLPSRPDEACGGAPRWETEISDGDLLHALRAAGFSGGRVRAVAVVARDASGRVARLALEGMSPGEISGQDLRVAVGRTLGWQRIKSAAFDVERVRNGFHLTGHGSGHGVGLCVIGSVHLAAGGGSAAAILARYFPGLAISPAAAAASITGITATTAIAKKREAEAVEGISVSLPDGDEGERVSIGESIARARTQLARALGIAAPAVLIVRVHPTIDSFERASGRAWFFSGAIVNGELHLPPLAALRQRGILERTIRRELVHAMIDRELESRPLWVRDGAALYFADASGGDRGAARGSCPADRELTQPVSLAAAYTRARSCFARQIAAGRSWHEVR